MSRYGYAPEYSAGAEDLARTACAELVAATPVTSMLVKGPAISHWRHRYSKFGMSVLINMPMSFDRAPRFGDQIRCRLTQTAAELLYQIYFVATIPGIRAVRTDDCDRRHQHRRRRSSDCDSSSDSTACDSHDTTQEHHGRRFDDRLRNFPHHPDAVKRADREVFHNIGRLYTDGDSGDGQTAVGRAEFLLRNYGKATQYGDCDSDSDDWDEWDCPEGFDPDTWCHYSNAIGFVLLKRTVLFVSTYPADILVREYLWMWEELNGKPGRRLREQIGKARTRRQLIEESAEDRTLFVPVPLYISNSPGSTYVYAAAKKSAVDLVIDLECLTKCIVKSDENVAVIKSATGKPICRNDIKAHVNATVVFVSELEKEQFEMSDFDQLMTQTQITTVSQKGKRRFGVPLLFMHPISEISWCLRRAVCERSTDYFNFSGLKGREPFKTVALRYDDHLRFYGEPPSFYRLVTPTIGNHNIPKGYIYNYCFGTNQSEGDPSSVSSPGVYRNVDLFVELQPGLEMETTTIFVAAKSYNFMRYRDGEVSAPLFKSRLVC